MENVVLVIHLLLALGIIALVLIQKSEGGGLGIGGSGGGLGNIATPQTTASVLTRATAILATAFFVTSLTLAVMAGGGASEESIAEELDQPAASAPQIEDTQEETPVTTEPQVPVSTQ
tara:strand:- start:397 stop:750 length:354 start_codon:yes stop_codon:yes gene_type:complete